MERLKRIEELLEKYYEGETSDKEELELRKFFTEKEVPEHWEPEREIFGYFEGGLYEDDIPVPESLESKIWDHIKLQDQKKKKNRRRLTNNFMNVAATVVILMGTGFLVYQSMKLNKQVVQYKDTYESAEMAYVTTKKTLLYVSQILNSGNDELKQLSKLEYGKNELKNISKLNQGIVEMKNISIFNKSIERVNENSN